MYKKGIWIAMGLNYVDPLRYAGWYGRLNACVNDATDMMKVAEYYGYKATLFINEAVTSTSLIQAIEEAKEELDEGDALVISYSGHGGQMRDLNNEEKDAIDETWCLHDRQFIDDELYMHLNTIPKKLNVVVLSDSCHSGTMLKGSFMSYLLGRKNRAMPKHVREQALKQNYFFYKGIQGFIDKSLVQSFKHNAILISGCQDNQYSMDGRNNGVFTDALLRTWEGGKFKGSYKQFHKAIAKKLPPTQTPNLMLLGEASSVYKPIFQLEI